MQKPHLTVQPDADGKVIELTVITEAGEPSKNVPPFPLTKENAAKFTEMLQKDRESTIELRRGNGELTGQIRIYKDAPQSTYQVIELIDLEAGSERVLCHHGEEMANLIGNMQSALAAWQPSRI